MNSISDYNCSIPETIKLALQSNCAMTQAAINGQSDPDTLDEADKALQNVPNCSGLNHYKLNWKLLSNKLF